MNKEQIIEQIRKLKKALEELEQRLADAHVPFTVLEEFKMAVDHIRLTVWAIVSSEGNKQYEMRTQIAEFRLKRTMEMCKQIILDIEANDITVDSTALYQCHALMKGTLDRIDRLYRSGI